MANYCPECGSPLQGAPGVIEAEAAVTEVAEVTASEVRIAEINAQKEITLARIQAGTFKDETVVELAVEAAHAEGEADGLREALSPPDRVDVVEEGSPEPVVAPVVISDDHSAPEVDSPPDSEEHEHDTHARRKSGLGMW
jgi:hypothetical protein